MSRRPQKMRIEPTTPWGRYLVARRERAGLNQSAVFKAVRDDLGWGPTSTASYGELERGKREPDPAEQQYFLARYGDPALPSEFDDPKAASVEPDLLGVIREQASAISELAAQVKALAEAQLSPADWANVVGAAVALAVREALKGAPTDVAPRQP